MSTRSVAKSVRGYRKIHRYLGLSISILLIISAITGVLLGWKKNIDLLQPPTQKGEQLDYAQYQPVESLANVAATAVDSLGLSASNIDRIEYRPTKGIAKVIFDTGSWEVQVDATNLAVLSVAKRHSDWIESLHDGSIISDFFKLISMNFLGIGLLFLIITGIWLWWGPKKIRAIKKDL
ncbi:PepSY-associated TM helix domain-containing protein [Roseivirga sp. E12]|uniref:PepSY-associated TM helix domain-containing protein n=1 Tax=Roseivirga sp. E12 TaxID=2819237 RepID=UPI001ABC1B23|nr:PepSY-associated TM helix domain-containing protein [Roseivirga sp. E12]MBO3699944.1 PepSY domain-containing protein [Roseivirga sp. E12]